MNLRPYQKEAKKRVYKSLHQHRKTMLQLPTGAGKTVTFCSMISEAVEHGQKVMVLAHRKELLSQAKGSLKKYGLDAVVLAPGEIHKPNANLFVASVPTVNSRINKGGKSLPKDIGFIVTDECFPSNIEVDGRPISEIKVGDYVRSYNHLSGKVEHKKVLATMRNFAPTAMVTVKFQDGQEITATAGHPFYSANKREYISAISLKPNEEVLYHEPSRSPLHNLRGEDSFENEEQNLYLEETRESILFGRTQETVSQRDICKNTSGLQQEACICADEEEQSYERSSHKSENVTDIKRYESQATSKGWEWYRSNEAPKTISGETGHGLEDGVTCEDGNVEQGLQKRRGMANPLQHRYSEPEGENSYRSRREFALREAQTNEGQEEREVFKIKRVESVEVQEQGSSEGCGSMCPDGYVYNIEVEGNNNYFAEGILVHNCHRSKAQSYKNIYDFYPDAMHLGVTATPYRRDGSGFEEIYKDLVIGVQMSELIRDGYLTAPTTYTVPLDIDLSKVKQHAGDYSGEDLWRTLAKSYDPQVYVNQWKKLANGRKSIFFAINIEHSKQVCAAFCMAGIKAVHLDGSTPDELRKDILQGLRDGTYDVLCNVDIATEGLDIPELECVMIARPTMSLSLYLQMGGRVLRTHKGKTEAIFIDFANNVFQHGFLEDDRQWSLEGQGINWFIKREYVRKSTGRIYKPDEMKDLKDVDPLDITLKQYRIDNWRLEYLKMLCDEGKAEYRAYKIDLENNPFAQPPYKVKYWNLFLDHLREKKKGEPTIEEIRFYYHELGKRLGCKPSWTRIQMIEHGYVQADTGWKK